MQVEDGAPHIDVTCLMLRKSESGKALQIQIGARKLWVPLSIIKNPRNANRADAPDLRIMEIPEWFARKEGIG